MTRPYGPGEEPGRVHGDEAGEGPCQSRKGCQGPKGMWPLAGVFEDDLATLGAGSAPHWHQGGSEDHQEGSGCDLFPQDTSPGQLVPGGGLSRKN